MLCSCPCSVPCCLHDVSCLNPVIPHVYPSMCLHFPRVPRVALVCQPVQSSRLQSVCAPFMVQFHLCGTAFTTCVTLHIAGSCQQSSLRVQILLGLHFGCTNVPSMLYDIQWIHLCRWKGCPMSCMSPCHQSSVCSFK